MDNFFSSTYLILGDGRLATQLSHYFKETGESFGQWSRKLVASGHAPDLKKIALQNPSLICLLAISDSALGEMTETLRSLGFETIVHFSGAADVPGTYAFHPLMTFAPTPWPREFFEKITFVGAFAVEDFNKIFPNFKNTFVSIPSVERALYHANCVLAGNFPNILWRHTMQDFARLGISPEALRAYVQATVDSFFHNPEASLTGPLVRGDWGTIEKNLQALGDDFRGRVYQEFLRALAPKRPAPEGELREHT